MEDLITCKKCSLQTHAGLIVRVWANRDIQFAFNLGIFRYITFPEGGATDQVIEQVFFWKG